MDALFDRAKLLTAFDACGPAIRPRTPKPILQSVKLTVAEDGVCTLCATDLELGLTLHVAGARAANPGAVLLPYSRVREFLQKSPDAEIAIRTEGDHALLAGVRGRFKSPTDDVALYPELPGFDSADFHVVAAGDLRRAIRRTLFATDVESTRYALGGLCLELPAAPGPFPVVGTDGRRLARQEVACDVEGQPDSVRPVVAVRALKWLADRGLAGAEDAEPVHLAFTRRGTDLNLALVRTGAAVLSARLCEGRYPLWRDAIPGEPGVRIPLGAGAFLAAVEQAAVATSEESRGVDFRFETRRLALKARAADVGDADVDMEIAYEGEPIEITFDARYVREFLTVFDPGTEIMAELIDGKNAAVFRTEDGYLHVVMPLTRDR